MSPKETAIVEKFIIDPHLFRIINGAINWQQKIVPNKFVSIIFWETVGGVVTANAGVVVDNITIDGNTISTTDTNGHLSMLDNLETNYSKAMNQYFENRGEVENVHDFMIEVLKRYQ